MQAEDDPPTGSADGKVHAAALAGQAGDERHRIGRSEAGLAQGVGQQARFPASVVGVAPMLQHAAAAAAEMAARRVDAGLAWVGDDPGDRMPAISARLHRMGAHGLVRQGERDVERSAVRQMADTIAFRPDPLDAELGRFRRLSPGSFCARIPLPPKACPTIGRDGLMRRYYIPSRPDESP